MLGTKAYPLHPQTCPQLFIRKMSSMFYLLTFFARVLVRLFIVLIIYGWLGQHSHAQGLLHCSAFAFLSLSLFVAVYLSLWLSVSMPVFY